MRRKICGFLNKSTVWALIVIVCCNMLLSCTNDMFGLNKPEKVQLSDTVVSYDSLSDAGGSHTLSASVIMKSGETSTGLEWYINDEVVVRNTTYSEGLAVDSYANGILIYRITAAGVYRIKAEAVSDRSKFAECVVTVGQPLRELHIQLGTDEETIVDQTIQVSETDGSFVVSAVCIPEGTYEDDVLWSVEDNGVLSISRQMSATTDTLGNRIPPRATIQIKSAGTATLTCRSVDNKDISASVSVIVRAKPGEQTTLASSLSIRTPDGGTSIKVPYNGDIDDSRLTAVVQDGYTNTISRGSVTWSSDNPSVISVTQQTSRTAVLQARKAGSAWITASFLDEGASSAVTASIYATVEGAVEGISSDSSAYRIITGETTDSRTIRISYSPSDTVQKGYSAVSSSPDIVVIQQENDDWLAVYGKAEGESIITLTSDADPSVKTEFTVIVTDEVSDSSRINKVTLSESALQFEPPFTGSSSRTVSATTWIRQDSSEALVAGNTKTYPVRFSIDDSSIASIRDTGSGTVSITPLRPGETTLRVESLVDPVFQNEARITVGGTLETLVANPGSVSLNTGTSKSITITPVPANALLTVSGEQGKAEITAETDAGIASSRISLLPSNNLQLDVTGVLPGTGDIEIYADGESILTIPVTVASTEKDYVTQISFSDPSVILSQDSEPVMVEILAYDQNGGRVKIDSDSIVLTLAERGRIYDDISSSDVVDAELVKSGTLSLFPKNSGVAVLIAEAKDNPFVSGECRIEVGGSDVQGDGLMMIRPESSYLQVRKGSTVETGVNFIPSDYENREISWKVIDDGTENVSYVHASDESRAEFLGVEKGTDRIQAQSAEKDVNTTFTIETVGETDDAYRIVLDRYYLSFDRNQKAVPLITATVYKNGRVSSERVEWETEEDMSESLSFSPSGNSIGVSLRAGQATGSGNVTARLKNNPSIYSTCYVEVIDSTVYDNDLRSLVFRYSSAIVNEDKTITVPFSTVPAAAAANTELEFTYTEEGVAEAVQDGSSVRITGLSAGSVRITATDKETGIGGSIQITVPAKSTKTPTTIDVSQTSVTISQEDMDDFVSITADILDRNGNVIEDAYPVFRTAPASSRYFNVKTYPDRIDTSLDPSDSIDYWGNDTIARNEIRIKPNGAGSSYITVSYGSLRQQRILVTVSAEEAVYQDKITSFLPSLDRLLVEPEEAFSVHVTPVPDNGDDHDIRWSTSDPRVATVKAGSDSRDAVITGVNNGEAEITAALSVDGRPVTASFSVTVEKDTSGLITGISVMPQHIVLDLDSKDLTQLNATVYRGGNIDSDAEVVWEVDDSLDGAIATAENINTANSILNISKLDKTGSGYITARSAEDGDFLSRAYVEVIRSSALEKVLSRLVLNTSHKTLGYNESFQIAASPVPSSISGEADFELSYETDSIDVASVTPDGVVTGKGAGNATITVTGTYGGRSVTATVEVTVDYSTSDPEYIEVSARSLNLSQEGMDSFESIEAYVIGTDGNRMADLQVEFTPARNSERYFETRGYDDEIDTSKSPSDGAEYWGKNEVGFNELRIKPVGAGAADIRISYPGLPDAVVSVTVSPEESIYQDGISELIPSVSKTAVATGSYADVWVTPVPDDGTDAGIVWSSVDTSVATVTADPDDSRFARIEGVREGETTVNATIVTTEGRKSASIRVVVADDISGIVTGLTLIPQHIVLDLDSKDLTQLSATVSKGGKADSNAKVVWSVDESLTENGAITATENINPANSILNISKGTETGSGYITATSADDPEVFSKALVEVVRSSTVEKNLSRILLNTDERTMKIGETFQIEASPVPSSIAGEAGWSVSYYSSDDRIASVSDTGLVTGFMAGRTTITVRGSYNDSTVEASLRITVENEAPATRVVLSENIVELDNVDAEKMISVQAFDSEGNDVTASAVFEWNVDTPEVADIIPDTDDSSKATVRAKKMDSSTRFTVTSGSLTAEGYIIVGNPPEDVIGIIAEPANLELSVNEEADIRIITVPESAAGSVTIKGVSGSNILSLEDNGDGTFTIGALREGYGTVSFTAEDENGLPLDGITAKADIRISGTAYPASISFSRGDIEFLSPDETAEVTAYILSDSGREMLGDVEWSLEREGVADIEVSADDANTVTVKAVNPGSTVLNAAFGSVKSSMSIDFLSKGISTETKPSSIYGLQSSIILNHPDADAAEETKEAVLEVGYYPQNLADQYKGLIWTLDGNSIEITDAEGTNTTDGTLEIRAAAKGVTTVTAYSREDRSVYTEFRVEVLDKDEVLPEGMPTLSLDKELLSLQPGGTGTVTAELKTGLGNDITDPGDALSWTIDDDEVASIQPVTPLTQKVSAGAWAGETLLTAKYIVIDRDEALGEEDSYIAATAVVEVADPDLEGQVIRSVELDSESLVLVIGSVPTKIRYTAVPNVSGLTAEWTSDNTDVVTVTPDGGTSALIAPAGIGEAYVNLKVTQTLNGRTFTAEDSMRVTVTNVIPASAKYEGLAASSTDLSLSIEDPVTPLSYTLTDAEGDESPDYVNEIRFTGINGEIIARYTADDTGAMTLAEGDNSVFSFAWYPGMKRMDITPVAPGTGFIEAYVYDDPVNGFGGAGVLARTYIAVTGDVKGVSVPTKYIHIAEGEEEIISISYSPDDAVIAESGAVWRVEDNNNLTVSTAEFDPATGLWKITNGCTSVGIAEPQGRMITIRGIAPGMATLTYSYTPRQGAETITSSAVIEVSSYDDIAGGLRKISFPSSFLEMPYPYSSELVTATVTYADGTTTESGITYTVTDAETGGDASSVLTMRYPSNGESGVYLQPKAPGHVYLEAAFTDQAGEKYTAVMDITIMGAVTEIIPSAKNIVLYTGGSTVVSVEPDDESAPNLTYRWAIENEWYGSDVSSRPSTESIELLTNYTSDGSAIIIDAMDVVRDESDRNYDPDIIAEYPRHATVVVTCPEYPNVRQEISVTVDLLPKENSYPKALSLSSYTENITGSQEDYTEMVATVTDSQDNPTSATIDWYYYPISKDYDWTEIADISGAERWMYKSWLNPNANTDPDFDSSNYVASYQRESTESVFWKPLQAGQYRFKAIVRENPKLQAECIVSIGPEVSGISTSVTDRLTLVKGENRTVDAVFTPDTAADLARDPVFILQSQKTTTLDPLTADAWSDGFVSLIVNGKSANIKAVNAHEAADPSSVLLVEYWDTAGSAALKEAMADGRLTVAEYRDATADAKVLKSAQLAIDVVPPTVTVKTLSISGIEPTIDPSSIKSAIQFSVSASSSGGSDDTEVSWDWIDVDIVGNDTGYVYATTRLMDDPSSADGEKKKIAACDWDEIGGVAIADQGKINRNGNTYFFVLNPNGIPLEPVVIKAYLDDAWADGKDEEGNIYFDPEKLSFSPGSFLCYIGAKVTGLSQGTTYYNVNNSVTESEGSQVNMILGANATLTVEYTPSYTHQKGVIWYAAAGDTGFTDFKYLPGGNQCSVFARNATDQGITLRALSIHHPWLDAMDEYYGGGWKDTFINMTPSDHAQDLTGKYRYPTEAELARYPEAKTLYTDYQVIIRSQVEKTTFTSYSQKRVTPEDEIGEYAFLPEDEYPSVTTDSEVFCYDSVGISGSDEESGENARIDAYYIQPDYFPDYGYDIRYEVEEGAMIGSIDMTGIDRESGSFRFVLKGPHPAADGTTVVTYGDVVIRFTCTDINYSETFTLHYLPSNMKLVKYIGRYNDGVGRKPDGSTVPDGWDKGAVLSETEAGNTTVNFEASGEWDTARAAGSYPEIYPLQTVILYPGEEFPVSVISYNNGIPQYVADGVTLDREGEDDKNYRHYAVRYGVYSDMSMKEPLPGYISFDGYLKDDFRTETDTGLSRWYLEPETVLTGNKEGLVYLAYTIVPVSGGEFDYERNEWVPSVDPETGQPVYPTPNVMSGEMIASGMWVYIAEPVDQMLSVVIENNDSVYPKNGVTELVPERISLSQLRGTKVYDDNGSLVKEYPSHWFMGNRGALNESVSFKRGSDKITAPLYRGVSYVSFSGMDRSVQVNGITMEDIVTTPYGSQGGPESIPSGSTHETYPSPIIISEKYLPKYPNAQVPLFNTPRITDVGLFGDYGLNRLRGVKAVSIEEDGTITERYVDSAGTLDLSGLNVAYYSHTGMVGGTWKEFGLSKVYEAKIKTLIPPHAVKEFHVPGNMLNCTFQWLPETKNTLEVLSIGDNPFSSFSITGFPSLWKVDASGNKDIFTTAVRKLDITGTPSLEALDLDDTQYTDVVASFRDGTGHFYDESWPVMLSARNSGSGSGELNTISVSGGIGFADIGSSLFLQSFISTPALTAGVNNAFDESEPFGGTWIQYLNLLRKPELASNDDMTDIVDLKGTAYSNAFGRELEKIGTGYDSTSAVDTELLITLKLDTIGYLTSADYYDPIYGEGDGKGTTNFRILRAYKPFELDNLDRTVSYQGLMVYSGEAEIDEIGKDSYVDIGCGAYSSVSVGRLQGTLDVTGSVSLKGIEANLGYTGDGTIIADGTGIEALDDIKAEILTLSISYAPDLKDVSILSSSPLRTLRNLTVTGGVYRYPNSLRTMEGSYVTNLEIGSDSALRTLSVTEGESLETMNIQGKSLTDIDLHNAGLYGDDWTIGSFVFTSGRPWNNIDGYTLAPDMEYTKGYNLSQNTFRNVELQMPVFKEYTYTDSNSETHTAMAVFAESEYEMDDTSVKLVDWKTWLPNLRHLRMNGNAIGFQWITGNADFTIGEAKDAGMIVGEVKTAADNLHIPNDAYYALKAKAEALHEAMSRYSDITLWFLDNAYNESRFGAYMTEEEFNDYVSILMNVYAKKIVRDSEGSPSVATDSSVFLYIFRVALDYDNEFVWYKKGVSESLDALMGKYYTPQPRYEGWEHVEILDYGGTYTENEWDWGDFSFSELTENGWNNNPATSSSDGHENDRFSIRFGTLDEDMVKNPSNLNDTGKDGLQVYVHNKYKQGIFISTKRRGFFQIQRAHGEGVYGDDGRVHSYSLIDRTGAADKGIISDLDINKEAYTRVFDFHDGTNGFELLPRDWDSYGADKDKTPARFVMDGDTEGVLPSEVLVDYRIYEEYYFAQYDHDSITIVYPFGV